jgi:YD repeat-containing protein
VSFAERTATAGKDDTYLTSFEYDKDDRVTEVAFDDKDRKDKKIDHGVRYKYDGAGLVKSKTVFNGDTKREVTYTPLAGKDSGSVSQLTKKISQPGLEFEYEYDDVGNIKPLRKLIMIQLKVM